jgi:WD40 repeat protein
LLTISCAVPKKKISSHGVDIGLWRAIAARNLENARNFDGSVNGKLSFSPNGEWLVIPDGKRARLWNTVNGSAVSTPIDQDGNIRVAAFSPNGRYLATGGASLMVWDIATGLKFPGKSFSVGQDVQDVAFSPDNKLLAFSSASKVGVWDIHSGEMLFKTSSDASH